MSDSPPNSRKRSLLDLLRYPKRLGRELGRTIRALRDTLNPPLVSEEEFAVAQANVAALETRIQELEDQHEQDIEAVEQLIARAAAQDQKLSEVLDVLRRSPLAQDQRELTRWERLRQRLLVTIGTLVGGTALAEALRDAWVQETLYPLLKELPAWARTAWDELMTPGEVQAQPASPLPAPDSPLPSSLEAPQTTTGRPPHTSLQIDPVRPELILVPGGHFWMGSDQSQDTRSRDNELPQHQLYLDAFSIARYPVTNRQYLSFVLATGHASPNHWHDGSIPTGKEQHPVTYVSWPDAVAYCVWLSQETGELFHLPSEAEWEKAARGTDARIYPWGNQAPNDHLCNFNGSIGDTTPVDAYTDGASRYGMVDMAGNVWEWTSSLYEDYPYQRGDGREDATPKGHFVVRGGSWLNNENNVRCAIRSRYFIDDLYLNVGFRVASPGH